MKVYRPQEVANVLKVKEPTLRKYSLLLEKSSYEFKKNDRGQRWYTDADVIAFQKLISLTRDNGMTLEEAADAVYLWSKGETVSEFNTDTTESITETEPLQNEDISEIKDIVNKQTELISKLIERIDRQQAAFLEYAENVDKEREEQRQLLLTFEEQRKEVVKEHEEVTKELESIAEQMAEQRQKGGFFRKLFGGNDK